MCNLEKVQFPKSSEYRSRTENDPILFFLDAFSQSVSFDLLLGYFSSTALNVLALGITKFLLNGGKMRIVINNVLSAEDKQVLQNASQYNTIHGNEVEYNFERIIQMLEEPGEHTLNCLAWLIENERIKIVAVKPKGTRGITHYKSGIFSDGKSKISFKGSCNFSAMAMLENLEEISIKKEWSSESERYAIQESQEYFDTIFNKESDDVEYVSFDKIEERIVEKYGGKPLNSILELGNEIVRKTKEKIKSNKRLEKRLDDISKDLFKISQEPRFPYPQGPRKYQQQAFENWQGNNFQGIFAMATGTGKTITSLNCLLEEYIKKGSYNAIILVPTIALVEQWEEECHKFNFRHIIKVAGHQKWESQLNNHFIEQSICDDSSLIIITTYNSFVREKFAKYYSRFKADHLLIADEAHNMGSKTVLNALPKIKQQKRIGLSATVERQYDDFGNSQLREFFNSHPPYTFNYSMKEAIENGVLSNYYYYPHIVTLSEIELDEYERISKQLAKFYSSDNDTYIKNEIVEILLLKRKRIIHKAQNKLTVFKRILQEEYKKKGELKNALVYVPEGDIDENLHDEPEFHVNLLREYTKAVRDVDKWMTVAQYTSDTKNRKEILKKFRTGEINLLTSMKCLDEGVDIPQTELAFFCASTGNPKQFIQRRGRVLRQFKGKDFAVIHDLIVVPNMTDEYDNTFKMQQSIVHKELERVVNFSFLALNKYHTFEVLDEVCKHYKLNLFKINETISDD